MEPRPRRVVGYVPNSQSQDPRMWPAWVSSAPDSPRATQTVEGLEFSRSSQCWVGIRTAPEMISYSNPLLMELVHHSEMHSVVWTWNLYVPPTKIIYLFFFQKRKCVIRPIKLHSQTFISKKNDENLCPHENLCMNVYSSFLYNSKKPETIKRVQ